MAVNQSELVTPEHKFCLGKMPTLQASGVRLEPFDNAKHMPELYAGLIRNPELMHVGAVNVTADTIEEQCAWGNKRILDERAAFFAVVDVSTGRRLVAGYANAKEIDVDNGSCTTGVLLLQAFHRTHVNTQVRWLLLNWIFDVLHLRRVEALVYTHNSKSLVALLRIGYILEGTKRHSHIVHPALTNYGQAIPAASGLGQPGLGNSVGEWVMAITFEDWLNGARDSLKIKAERPLPAAATAQPAK